MGNIQSQISSMTISFMDGGEDKNKYRLIKTYKNYIEHAKLEGKDEKYVYQMLSIEANKDGSALGDILYNEGLNWPSSES